MYKFQVHSFLDDRAECLGKRLHKEIEFAESELHWCIWFAKRDSASYRATKDRRFISLRKDDMQDARYWRKILSDLNER